MADFKNKTVGEIVAQNIGYARVFDSLGIDFCCSGNVLLSDAARKAGVSLDNVIAALKSKTDNQSLPLALDFDAWSLELLIDYVVKFHHHYIKFTAPKIYTLLEKVANAHGESDRHLYEVKDLFLAAFTDLGNHLAKEENILFPLVKEIQKASDIGDVLPEFHCGSVQNPIRVMMQEHDNEGKRFRRIAELTNGYKAPAHACDSYKLLLDDLNQFEQNLHIHIHVENNILFRKAILLEEALIDYN